MPIIRDIQAATVVADQSFDFKGAWSLAYFLRRGIVFKPPSGGRFLPPLPGEKIVYGELLHQDPDAAERAFNLTGYVDPSTVSLEIFYLEDGTERKKHFRPVIFGAYPPGDELRTLKGPDAGQPVLQSTSFILAMPADGDVAQYIFTEDV